MTVFESRVVHARDGREVTLRSAEERDAEQLLGYLAELLTEPHNVLAPGERDPTVEEEREWIRTHRGEPGQVVIVADIGGVVVGLLNFRRGPWRRLHHRGTFGMSVAKTWRGKRIGDALVEAMLDWARAEPGIVKVGLVVFAKNQAAIGLYEKHGFKVEGRRSREIRLDDGTYADDLLMCRFVDA